MEQEVPLQTSPNIILPQEPNHIVMSNLWIRLLLITTAVKSILGLIILFLLLGESISILIIGFHFRHSQYCPIERNISLFLIVSGSVSVVWIIFSIILSIITIVLNRIRSLMLVIFVILTALMIIISHVFLFIWVIIGSIWTFKALDMVQHIDPHIDTFCEQTLYQSTLGYLIMIYVLFALQCWYRLFIGIFCYRQEHQI